MRRSASVLATQLGRGNPRKGLQVAPPAAVMLDI
jgi:hypothetical protein